MKNPMEVVYKFRWVKKRVKLSGAPCQICKKEFGVGTIMYVKRNRYNGMILASHCVACHPMNKEALNMLEKPPLNKARRNARYEEHQAKEQMEAEIIQERSRRAALYPEMLAMIEALKNYISAYQTQLPGAWNEIEQAEALIAKCEGKNEQT